MAPKRAQARAKPVARRGAAAKRAAQVTTSNVRKKARRDACTALHTLAAEFAVPGLSADARRQACNTETERLARVLQGRCQAPEAAARLRAAVQAFLDHGGQFEAEVVPEAAADVGPAEAAAEAAPSGDAEPSPVPRHKLFASE